MMQTKDPKAIVDRRFDFVLLFDVMDGNPNGDPDAGIAHASQKIGDRGEGAHKRQVRRLETLAAPFLHFLAVVPLFVGGQEDWNELVAALSYLASRLLECHVVTELRHRFMPSDGVQIDGVQQRPVQVEDRGVASPTSEANRQDQFVSRIGATTAIRFAHAGLSGATRSLRHREPTTHFWRCGYARVQCDLSEWAPGV